jgi:hypothetical protein
MLETMPMIPMTFHFSFYRGTQDWKWRDIHTLALRSCRKFAGAQKIIVHYDEPDTGELWDEAWALPDIEWRKVKFTPTINTHTVTDQRIICDVYRLQTLWEEGGFYCDLDFVFLKSFEPLRDADAIIGTQCKQKMKLACGLMGCMPGSTFIRAYLDKYQEWSPELQKKFWIVANNWPWDLAQKYPVKVLQRTVFYPVAWSNKSFWSGGKVALRNAHALHLWETLKPHLTIDDLRKTALSSHIEQTYAEQIGGIAHRLPGTVLTWE